MLLNERIALVTGASRGIGRSIARVFAEQGAIVYANARILGCLDDFANDMQKQCGAQVIPLYFDVTNSREAKEAVLRIKKEQGRLDVLINNAGIMKDALLGMISEQMLEDTFRTNVFAVINLTQIASKLMVRQKKLFADIRVIRKD